MSEENKSPCKPGGPYCVGMTALLDAQIKGGIQIGEVMNVSTLSQRQVVGQYIKRGKARSFLVFTVCPCCTHPVSEESKDMKRGGRKPKNKPRKRTRGKRIKVDQAPAEPTPTEPKETP